MEPEILLFAQYMANELKANEHKGDWRRFTDVSEIVAELDYHVLKLKRELEFESENSPEKIKEYLADCANFMLMIGNAYALYE